MFYPKARIKFEHEGVVKLLKKAKEDLFTSATRNGPYNVWLPVQAIPALYEAGLEPTFHAEVDGFYWGMINNVKIYTTHK